MYLNKALLFGNLTRDPEMRALPNGGQVASFSIATNRVYKDKNGEKKETTEFHNVVAFGKQAELIGQYCKKGKALYVEGRLQTRSWESEGQKKYRTEIVLENFQFGDSARGAGAGAGAGGAKSSRGDEPSAAKSDEEIKYPDEEINPEDIPF